MFYCDNCARKNEWPTTGFISYGRCEICEKTGDCSDMPSKHLPKPKPKDMMNSVIPPLNRVENITKVIQNRTQRILNAAQKFDADSLERLYDRLSDVGVELLKIEEGR